MICRSGKAFDSSKESCGMGNEKGIPEALVTAVMSLHKGARTKVKVVKRFSEEYEVNIGVHQGSVLSSLLFTIVVDVMNEIRGHVTRNIVCG